MTKLIKKGPRGYFVSTKKNKTNKQTKSYYKVVPPIMADMGKNEAVKSVVLHVLDERLQEYTDRLAHTQ